MPRNPDYDGRVGRVMRRSPSPLPPLPRTLAAGLSLAVVVATSALWAAPLSPQDHMGHMGHGDPGVGWRMVPMDPNMPMLPGLATALPSVAAFLPGAGMEPSMFPEARPSELVSLSDGDTLAIAVSMVRRTINGHEMVMYGYNGQYPGPLIRAPEGSTITVRVTNEIDLPTTVHWHGIRLQNRFDGVPGVTQDPIGMGESFTYRVHVPDDGMFWYHPHVREDVQQDLGLFGNLLVTPADESAYDPVHREELLVLDDILMDEHGPIPWGEDAPTHALMGRFGNVFLVNGETGHRLNVGRGEVVRFFITNVANSRTFNVTFGDNPVKLVASDIGRYEHEQWVNSVVIAPAERYVVEVRFDDPGEVAIANTIQAINHFRGEFYPRVDTLVMVDVGDAPPTVGAESGDRPPVVFDELRENPDVMAEIDGLREHFDRPPDHELEATVRVSGLHPSIVLSMEADTLYFPPIEWNDGMPMMNWLSTGNEVEWILRDRRTGTENGDIDWRFQVGDVVKVRIFNSPDSFHPMNHPIHIHGQRFLVLDMDGVRSRNLVWKDTAIVPVGSTADFLVEMSNPGEWMVHCHIAEHLSAGMMFSFVVEGK